MVKRSACICSLVNMEALRVELLEPANMMIQSVAFENEGEYIV